MKTKDIKKKASGITLIALVVTIIVLLILAGISISMLSGDNSILQKATDAKTQTGIGQEKETIALAYNSAFAKKINNGDSTVITAGDLNREFIINQNQAIAIDRNNSIYVVFDTGNSYILDNSGNIEKSSNKLAVVLLDKENEDILVDEYMQHRD